MNRHFLERTIQEIEMVCISGALEARKEAGEHRRPVKYRIGIALVVELNDANVIDITPLKEGQA